METRDLRSVVCHGRVSHVLPRDLVFPVRWAVETRDLRSVVCTCTREERTPAGIFANTWRGRQLTKVCAHTNGDANLQVHCNNNTKLQRVATRLTKVCAHATGNGHLHVPCNNTTATLQRAATWLTKVCARSSPDCSHGFPSFVRNLFNFGSHGNTQEHTTMHCNTLQHTATHCNALHHTATHCITLQHTATH